MSYKDSWLWRKAFVDPREDAAPSEQEWFRQSYEGMRGKATHLVGRIANDLKEMTVHDITHLDSLWEMGSIVTEGKLELNPPEAFVYGGAILLHDAAMTLAAYPDGLESLKKEVAWRDSYARLAARSRENGQEPDSTTEGFATADALRRLHALQAEKLPTMAWSDTKGGQEYLIDDEEARRFYGPSIGKIAHSHWWSTDKVEDQLYNDLGPLGGKTKCRIDLVKIACLLRVSDAIHLDRRRAPEFLRKLVKPEGISSDHWEFQGRLAVPFIRDSALVFSASPSFELAVADAWWLAYDAVEMVDRELRSVDRLLQRRGTTRLLASRVEGATSPTDLARYVETDGWTPVDSTVRVSDVPKIVATLGGSKLYGNNPTAALRELIQNAADAVEARRKLQNRAADWGEVTVSLETRDGAKWLIIDDTGIGMSSTVLTGPLIDFGNSLWRSPLAAEEFPGLQAAGIDARGRFGIGFFSVFMLGDEVRVISRRFDKASSSGAALEFRKGLRSRPILYEAPDQAPVDGGTRIEVKLVIDLEEKGGLLRKNDWSNNTLRLRSVVAGLAPALSVRLITVEDGESSIVVEPRDWVELAQSRLLNRLARQEDEEDAEDEDDSRLRLLKGPDGQIYGRAMIEHNSWGSSGRGCVSLGGLRAVDAGFFRGVIVGSECTAARDDAVLAVPDDILSSWATEQAGMLAAAELDGEDKARAATVVLMFGGDIGELPVARHAGKWLRRDELDALIRNSEVLKVYTGNVRYDEDLDEVHPRDFKEAFEDADDVVFVPDSFPGFRESSARAVMPPNINGGLPSNLEDLLLSMISEAWEEVHKVKAYRQIGSVLGESIDREVYELRRSSSEEID